MKALAAGAALVLLLTSGCAAVKRRGALAAYCAQAVRQGWCSPACGRRQPAWCRPALLVQAPRPDDCSAMEELDDGGMALVLTGACAPPDL